MSIHRREFLSLFPVTAGGITCNKPRNSSVSGLRNNCKTEHRTNNRQESRNQPVFEQTAEIVPDDPGRDDNFGQRISVSGDTALILGRDDVSDLEKDRNNSVYVFERDENGWTQQTKLHPEQDDHFGSSIVLEGDTALVANSDYGTEYDHFRSGRVYVYKRINGTWIVQDTLSTGENSSYLGASMDITGSSILIGGKRADSIGGGLESGKVFVAEQTGTSWDLEAELVPDGLVEYERFGESVAADDDTAIVGNDPTTGPNATAESQFGRNAHTVYVFERTDGEWQNAGELFVDDWEDKSFEGEFGNNLSLSEDTALISGYGEAYVFVREESGWNRQAKLGPESDNEDFGEGVALVDETAVVTAPNARNGDRNGAVYVFERTDGTWEQRSKRYPAGISDAERPRVGGHVGYPVSTGKPNPVALTESSLVVGAPGIGVNDRTNAGTAFVFDRITDENQQTTEQAYRTRSGDRNRISNPNIPSQETDGPLATVERFYFNQKLPLMLIAGGIVIGIGFGVYRHYSRDSMDK